jgi:hypothetical protein
MASQTIIPATQYTPLPSPRERFSPSSFAWIKKPKLEPLRVKEQLPHSDMDELKRLWEETDGMLASQRWEDQDGFKDEKRQMGKPMWSNDVISRVLKMNPRLIVQDSTSMKGSAAFYFVNPDKTLKYTNACFNKGLLPEFTIMTTDTADLPVYYPRYGYRTVLVRLLKGGYISYQQILHAFGEVEHQDHRGRHWWLNVRKFR